MKKLYLFIFLTFLGLGSISIKAQYCPLYGNCADSIISLNCSNVSISGIATSCASGSGFTQVSNDTIYLAPGSTYVCTVKNGRYVDSKITGWLDESGNQVFDAQERIEFATGTVNFTHTGSIIINPTTTERVTLLRIVLYSGGDVVDPCTGGTVFGTSQVLDIPVKITTASPPPSNNTPTYCAASGDCGATSQYPITNVSLTGDNGTSINNNSGCGNYTDFTNIKATVTAGSNYTITVMAGINALGTGGIFIDWNNNGVLDDPGEALPSANAQPFTFAFVPPTTEKTGFKRMRVRTTSLANSPAPCGVQANGEVEDYTLYYVNPDAPLPSCVDKTKSTPQDDNQATCQKITFKWARVTDADGYKFTLMRGANFEVKDFSMTDTFYVWPNALTPGTTYRWIALPFNENGNALGCDTLTFTVSANQDPSIQFLPADFNTICEGDNLNLDGNPQNGTAPFTHTWEALDGAQLAPPVTNKTIEFLATNTVGTYTIKYTVTDANVCQAIDTIAVFVSPSGKAGTASAQPSMICAGQGTTINISGADGNISWEQADNLSGPWTSVQFNPAGANSYTTPALSSSKYFRATATKGNCADVGEAILVDVVPLSPKPLILPSQTTACEGDVVYLRTTNYNDDIVWNDSFQTTNDSLEVEVSGTYTATYTGFCSVTSDPFTVTFNPNPAKPSITLAGNNPACDGEVITLSSSETGGNTWSTGETTDAIQVSSSNIITVTQTNSFGCSTQSDALSIVFNPVPAQPIISLVSTGPLCEGSTALLTTNTNGIVLWTGGINDDTLAVQTSGTYFATFTDVNGCQSTSDAYDVQFAPLPSKPTITSNGLFCEGETVVLKSSSIGNNLWNTGASTDSILVNTDGNYTVTVVDVNACENTSDIFAVQFEALPDTPVVVQIGDSLKCVTQATAYQWFGPNGLISGATNQFFAPGASGKYTVRVISQNGCVSAASDSVFFSGVGLSKNLAQSSGLRIYPNPSNGKLKIKSDYHVNFTRVEITDVSGRLVQKIEMNKEKSELILALPAGTYLVKLFNDQELLHTEPWVLQ